MTVKEKQILEYVASKRGSYVHTDILMTAYNLDADSLALLVDSINKETGIRMLSIANQGALIIEVGGLCRKWIKEHPDGAV